MSAKASIDLLAQALYRTFNSGLKWLEPDWALLPEATRVAWEGCIQPAQIMRLEDAAKLAYIRYCQSKPEIIGWPAWEYLASSEQKRWRTVIGPLVPWGKE